MKKVIGLLILSFLIFSCAQKSGNIRQSAYKSPGTTQGIKKTTPEFSIFKGEIKGKAVKPESIEEAKISEKESGLSEENIGKAQENINFKLRDIHFDFDSSTIKPQDIPFLETLAQWLISHPKYKLIIEGHCDERGSEMYNLALGQRRADAVKKFLVNLGVSPDRITTISYGEEKPIDPRHCEEAWAKNRRCHFIIEE